MESFTREVSTATQKFGENDKLSEMLAMFAQGLFEEGLIQLSTRYDKDTGQIYKELSAKLIRDNR
jgi:septation ring formation regulator EzrA